GSAKKPFWSKRRSNTIENAAGLVPPPPTDDDDEPEPPTPAAPPVVTEGDSSLSPQAMHPRRRKRHRAHAGWHIARAYLAETMLAALAHSGTSPAAQRPGNLGDPSWRNPCSTEVDGTHEARLD